MARPLLIALLLLWTTVPLAENRPTLTPEQVIQQELLLNSLIQDIYLLQLEGSDPQSRERLADTLSQLDHNQSLFPKSHSRNEVRQLLQFSHGLWPIISTHVRWLVGLSDNTPLPKLDTLEQALVRMDRQLQVLRQTLLVEQPAASALRFLEQALLMQKIAREYLYLARSGSQAVSAASQQPLQHMTRQFDLRLSRLLQELADHPHASQPLRQASLSWQFIARNIGQFPKQPLPSTIIRYSKHITTQLVSIYPMF